MILTDLRTAIVAQIKTDLPSLKSVEAHGGRFTLPELKAVAVKSPAVRVACLGVSRATSTAQGVDVVAAWGAFVISKDLHPVSRDAVTLGLVSALLPIVPLNCWGLEDYVDSARDVRADNLFSRDLDAQGVSIWAVTWRHTVTLGRVDESTLDDFLRAWVEYDINQDGVVDTMDKIDLPAAT